MFVLKRASSSGGQAPAAAAGARAEADAPASAPLLAAEATQCYRAGDLARAEQLGLRAGPPSPLSPPPDSLSSACARRAGSP